MPQWPNGGVHRQITDGSSTGFFKGLITSLEKSNPGYIWDWNEKSLIGKKYGLIYRNEEYINSSGTSRWSAKPFRACSVEKITSGNYQIPADKPAANNPAVINSNPASYSNVPDMLDDLDLPF